MIQAVSVSYRNRHPDAATQRRGSGSIRLPDPRITDWIRRTLAGDPPRARSLIVTVWGDSLAPHGGSVWLSGLIALMAPFGINDRLVRTSVFRLARDGWLAGTPHGRRSRYRLTSEGAARFDEAYRRIYARPESRWDGTWELVLAGGVAQRERAAWRHTLSWSGFGTLNATTFVRPHHPHDPHAAPLLTAGAARAGTIWLHARDHGTARTLASVAQQAWDLPALAVDYRRFMRRFGSAIERFRRDSRHHDAAQCFIVRTMLIHAFRRVLLRDPLLPAALLPLDWPGAAAYALCRDFYRLTHCLAERHLTATLAAGGEGLPPADATFHARFGGLGYG